MTIPTSNNEFAENDENGGNFSQTPPETSRKPSAPVKKYSPEYWAENPNKPRCRAHRKNGNQCLRPPIRGATVCFRHGGAASQVKSAARARLENAADRMARELLQMAEGAESEAVKLNAIRDALDRAGLGPKSEVTVELKPWERLMGDIGGVANISRAQHHALGKAPVIDAELVEPPALDSPARPASDDGHEMRSAERTPGRNPPPHSPSVVPPWAAEPGEALVTMDEAVIMDDQHRIARGKRWR